jgi:hypothetical protein
MAVGLLTLLGCRNGGGGAPRVDELGEPAGPGVGVPRPPEHVLARAGPDQPEDYLDRFARSYMAGRSGQVFYVVEPGYYMTFRWLDFNHGSPWDYDSRVPLVFYGPGQVRTGTHEETGAQPWDIPATLSAALRIPPPPDSRGRAWVEVLEAERSAPRALFVVVMDQVGFQDVERFAGSMPTLARWRREGADFPDVELNYLPTMTAVSHTGVGTGGPPAVHGIVSNTLVGPDDASRVVYRTDSEDRVSPEDARVGTFADWMDQRFQNRPVVISQVYAEYAAVSMAGRGLSAPGGDADIVVWHGRSGRPITDTRFYRIPDYIASRDVAGLKEAHANDYLGFDLSKPGKEHEAAWYARWEAENALEMMRREGVGTDDAPDLVMLNLKTSDSFGHAHGHDHPGYRAALAEIDGLLRDAAALLDEQAGEGNWVAVVTADHGLVPDLGSRLNYGDYRDWLNEVLDDRGDRDGEGPVIEVFGGQVHLDAEEAAEDGTDPEAVAALLASDPGMRHTWTEAQVRERQATVDIDRSRP